MKCLPNIYQTLTLNHQARPSPRRPLPPSIYREANNEDGKIALNKPQQLPEFFPGKEESLRVPSLFVIAPRSMAVIKSDFDLS